MARQPKLVLMFANDWGRGDLGCYGHHTIRTTHLVPLAAAGGCLLISTSAWGCACRAERLS